MDRKLFDFHDSYLWIYELNQDLKLFSRFDKLLKSNLSKKMPILNIFSDLQNIFGLSLFGSRRTLLLVIIPILNIYMGRKISEECSVSRQGSRLSKC